MSSSTSDSALWIIVELSPRAEGEDPDVLKRVLTHLLRGAEVFIPATTTQVGKDKVVHYLVDGYAFIRKDRPSSDYQKLERSAYVHSVLYQSSKHDWATVHNEEIQRMRLLVTTEADQGIGIGDTVTITAGPYKEIPAIVIEDMPELNMVQVHVKLLSKEAILTLPRGSLRVEHHVERSPLYARVQRFKTWLRQLTVVASWKTAKIAPLTKAVLDKELLTTWLQKGAPLHEIVSVLNWDFTAYSLQEAIARYQWASVRLKRHLDLSAFTECMLQRFRVPPSLKKAQREWSALVSVASRGSALYCGIAVLDRELATALPDMYFRWKTLESLTFRLASLTSEITDLKRSQRTKNSMINNLVIDGFNLAFRCGFAPGMNTLKDTTGRATGIVFGFLRSLASYKKKYPNSVIYVCWDSSNARRKAMFAGYKSNRPERKSTGFDQIGFLRDFLPLLGVTQAFNPDEEADDVIATLVRGPLAAQRNLIVSTDRDFLQLVTPTTVVLAPGAGSVVYDADKVLAEYGVPPEKMVHLRAFLGDTSDNIPGVPRVPQKILLQLLRTYDTLEGVLSSSLSGISKSQYQKVRSAEPQIRLNYLLMSLLSDIQITTIAPATAQKVAEERLLDLNIKSNTVQPFFSAPPSGFLKD